MTPSLAQAERPRHVSFMPTKPKVDEDARRLGRALARLRERVGVTQQQAGEAYGEGEGITSQYWAMHENGKVPGIFKPAVQRKVIEALNRASGAEPPLTIEDLEREISAQGGPDSRMARIARELGATAPHDGGERFEFMTSDGPVVLNLPARLTSGGFEDLEAFLAVFLQRRRRALDA